MKKNKEETYIYSDVGLSMVKEESHGRLYNDCENMRPSPPDCEKYWKERAVDPSESKYYGVLLYIVKIKLAIKSLIRKYNIGRDYRDDNKV